MVVSICINVKDLGQMRCVITERSEPERRLPERGGGAGSLLALSSALSPALRAAKGMDFMIRGGPSALCVLARRRFSVLHALWHGCGWQGCLAGFSLF